MNLVQAWPEPRSFQFIVTRGADASKKLLPDLFILGASENAEGLTRALDSVEGDDVLVQYSGFGFDPKGCPRWMPDVLAAWKLKKKGRRVAIMFHELWTKRPLWDPRVVRSWRHRYSIGRLIKLSSAVYTNTEGYAGWLRALNPRVSVSVIPVGCNVQVQTIADLASRERGLLVVFGKQGTRMLALHTMKESLARLAQAGRLNQLLIVGGSPDGAQTELSFARQFLPEEKLGATGFMDDEALSELLARAEFGVSGQDWLSVEKSTTFMAYAAHGLNILSPYAGTDERAPFNWLTGVDELLTDDMQMEQKLRDRSRSLREWYESTASWSAIATKMSAGLRIKNSVSEQVAS